MKGVALGAAVSAAILTATAAVAGTGVGGVFNLGKTNQVNATTGLKGAVAGAQLSVSNTNTGAGASGINVQVASGKPPIVTNSSSKVQNLNADQLDGLDSTQLQRPLNGACYYGEALRSVTANGTVVCASSVTIAIARSFSSPASSSIVVAPGLTLRYSCQNPSTSVGFEGDGTASTINWMFSQGGSSSTVNASGASIPNSGIDFVLSGSRLEGQFIVATTTRTTTVNLHVFQTGSYCEYDGTAESAALNAP